MGMEETSSGGDSWSGGGRCRLNLQFIGGIGAEAPYLVGVDILKKVV